MSAEVEKRKSKPKSKHSFNLNLTLLIILLILLILISVAVPATVYFLHRGESRDVLSAAKTVRLSITANAYEYLGEDDTMEDLARQNHLKKDAEEKILTLAGCQGEIVYVDFDQKEMKVNKLIYLENGYIAIYDVTGKDLVWNVYRAQHLFP